MRVAMSSAAHASESILIASDNSSDAALVKELLSDTFGNVFTTTVAEQAVDDFEHRLPQVLVLAFDALEKAERYCLGLDRLGGKTHSQPHRTVILCDKNEVRQVVELCIKQTFDDYVLFWPMNHDAFRLHMAVRHALRDLALRKDSGPSVAQFAAQARRLSEMEALLDQQVALGRQCIDIASLSIEQAERGVSAALQGFSRRLSRAALSDVVEVRDAAALEREVAKLRRDEVQQPLRLAVESIQPIRHWVDEFRQAFAPHLESARALSALADQLRPTILIVDDDDFQRKIVAKIFWNRRTTSCCSQPAAPMR